MLTLARNFASWLETTLGSLFDVDFSLLSVWLPSDISAVFLAFISLCIVLAILGFITRIVRGLFR